MTTNNTNIVRLHRVLRATPERVYRAFLDAECESAIPRNTRDDFCSVIGRVGRREQ